MERETTPGLSGSQSFLPEPVPQTAPVQIIPRNIQNSRSDTNRMVRGSELIDLDLLLPCHDSILNKIKTIL